MLAESMSLAARYADDGFVFPVDVLSTADALAARRALETLEAAAAGRTRNFKAKHQLNHPHLLFTFADALVRHPALLAVVEALIGPDILVWGSTFFIKEPRSASYVSWHQDLRYWGLSDEEGQVSAWLALSPVTRENGAMAFVPGSHHGPLLAHRDTHASNNALTRGQEAEVAIDEADCVDVTLEPGQASFHHGRLLHASRANRSDERRIGLAIQYVAPHVRQTLVPADYAVQVRGEDRHGHFLPAQPPQADLSEDALAWHARVVDAQNDAFYT